MGAVGLNKSTHIDGAHRIRFLQAPTRLLAATKRLPHAGRRCLPPPPCALLGDSPASNKYRWVAKTVLHLSAYRRHGQHLPCPCLVPWLRPHPPPPLPPAHPPGPVQEPTGHREGILPGVGEDHAAVHRGAGPSHDCPHLPSLPANLVSILRGARASAVCGLPAGPAAAGCAVSAAQVPGVAG